MGVLITGCDGDQFIDRQVELVKMIEKKGIQRSFRCMGIFMGLNLLIPPKVRHCVLY